MTKSRTKTAITRIESKYSPPVDTRNYQQIVCLSALATVGGQLVNRPTLPFLNLALGLRFSSQGCGLLIVTGCMVDCRCLRLGLRKSYHPHQDGSLISKHADRVCAVNCCPLRNRISATFGNSSVLDHSDYHGPTSGHHQPCTSQITAFPSLIANAIELSLRRRRSRATGHRRCLVDQRPAGLGTGDATPYRRDVVRCLRHYCRRCKLCRNAHL